MELQGGLTDDEIKIFTKQMIEGKALGDISKPPLKVSDL